ncbi:MAG: polyprenyl synthetase family protein [Ruminococcaceae bacterium]|nr:polyprenyl synthetase family protein [Oscillospiraceae bacterium]
MIDIKTVINSDASLMEAALEKYLSMTDDKYPVLFEAMRYGVLDGGKRVRPFLAIEFCRMAGGCDEAVIPFAVAIECIHSYSLVHDDLPCMDNDDLRRGKPTNHKKFGEANALLCGDALLTFAFEAAASNDKVSAKQIVDAIKLLSDMSGANGMIGGQQIDLLSEGRSIDMDTLKYLHSKKTGCLIRCAAALGCIAAGDKCTPELYEAADKYASGIGLCFQIIDDILDVTGDEEVFGKPIGSDAEQNKTTFMSFMSVEDAYKEAQRLTNEAKDAISGFEGNEILCEFADYLLNRNK